MAPAVECLSVSQVGKAELQRDRAELEEVLGEAHGVLRAESYAKLQSFVARFDRLWELIEDKQLTIDKLRKALFGGGSEKSRTILSDHEAEEEPDEAGEAEDREATAGSEESSPEGTVPEGPKSRRGRGKGHGRYGSEAYPGATWTVVPHPTLNRGDRCPECCKGKVYGIDPQFVLRLYGQAPVGGSGWELERLRCNLCGKLYPAPAPPEARAHEEKHDATAKAMIAQLVYGQGQPFHRLEKLQANLGIPLAASTQSQLVAEAATEIEPAFTELRRQAAQAEVFYNDDTDRKILEAKPQIPKSKGRRPRTGMFTTAIVAQMGQQQAAIFSTGRQHAGENLADLLQLRDPQLAPPMLMCDALNRNVPKSLRTILANCLAHGRRQFVDILKSFPVPCRKVIEALGLVYEIDERAKKLRLSAHERLRMHQTESAPVMESLKQWMQTELHQRQVEPNSGLGKAFAYMLNHWEALTLFLRHPGAPLDNNICERALKMTIRHRRNSLFYRSDNGAKVGDLFMSLIHTCELAGANAFHYLVEIQKHAKELATHPGDWMPWNYRKALESLSPV